MDLRYSFDWELLPHKIRRDTSICTNPFTKSEYLKKKKKKASGPAAPVVLSCALIYTRAPTSCGL